MEIRQSGAIKTIMIRNAIVGALVCGTHSDDDKALKLFVSIILCKNKR
jgi:hypothetical protein